MAGMIFPEMDVVPKINEKRVLAERPQLKLTSYTTFPGQFENFFNDHFGYRNLFLRYTNLLKMEVLKVSGSSKIVVGKDDWLFYTGNSSYQNYMGILPNNYEKLFWNFKQQLEAKKQALNELDIEYIFVVTPSKWTVYSEYLPDGYETLGRQTNVDRLLAYLRANSSVEIVDLRSEILIAKQNENRKLFYLTDSHWNDLGAYYGYLGISNAVAKRFPAVLPRKISDFEIVADNNRRGRDLAGMLGLQGYLFEEPLKLTPHKPYRYRLQRENGKYSGSLVHYVSDNTALPRAFMFRDSFSSQIIPYLSDDFSSIAYLWKEWDGGVNLRVVLNHFRPDVVIEQRAERYLVPFPADR